MPRDTFVANWLLGQVCKTRGETDKQTGTGNSKRPKGSAKNCQIRTQNSLEMFKYLSGVQIAFALLSKPKQIRTQIIGQVDDNASHGHLVGILSRSPLFKFHFGAHCACGARMSLVFRGVDAAAQNDSCDSWSLPLGSRLAYNGAH